MQSATDRPPSAAMLVEGKALLDAALAAGQVDVSYIAALSDVYDRYFRERLLEYQAGSGVSVPFALAAVGGYGRRELCPASDIDVLVLFDGEAPAEAPELARFLFFPLWDLGVDLGNGVRTVAQCAELAAADPQVFASVLDLRFLAGDPGVVERLGARLETEVFPAGAIGFVNWLTQINAERGRAYGDAGGMLEPNLKNGLGGLRDWHQVRWLARLAHIAPDDARLAPELAALNDDGRFILTARIHLHRLCARKNDKLYFEFQERLAESMGFGQRGDRKGVERFLSRLLRRMADSKALRLSVWPLLAGATGALDLSAPATAVAEGVELAPEGLRFRAGLADTVAMERVFDLFLACAATGSPPSHDTLRRLRGMGDLFALSVGYGHQHGVHRKVGTALRTAQKDRRAPRRLKRQKPRKRSRNRGHGFSSTADLPDGPTP